MDPITWSIVTEAAGWLKQAMAAARTKEQQRFARVVEHAGTVTAGLRALDREAHRLFLPMVYGDIRTWPQEQRQKWTQELVSFAYEDKITPAMRVSLTALNELVAQQSDRDISRIVGSIVDVVGWGSGQWQAEPRLGAARMLQVIANYETIVEHAINYIIEALENPGEADVEQFKSAVRAFVYIGETGIGRDPHGSEGGTLHYLEQRMDSVGGGRVTALRPFADMAEVFFGQLLALQHRIFPEIPTPVWVWQPG